jgi:putative transposase
LARSETEAGIGAKRRCELLGVPRSTLYYKPRKKTKDPLRGLSAEEKEKRMAEIDRIHSKMPATGARKMAKELTRKGMPTTRWGATALMEAMNIRCVYPRPNLSRPSKGHPKFPYLLKDKRIWLPNQVWAIDITYVPFKGGHMYLTAVIDWHSRLILGWSLADSLDNAPVLACAKEAFERYGIPACMNSDQGSHFTSKAYVKLLSGLGIAQSMDGKARWVDNVIIERWFRTLKHEYLYIEEFSSPRELKAGIAGFIETYNNERLHEALGYQTPAEVWSEAFGKVA